MDLNKRKCDDIEVIDERIEAENMQENILIVKGGQLFFAGIEEVEIADFILGIGGVTRTRRVEEIGESIV